MPKLYRYNNTPINVSLDNISHIYTENNILYVILKNGDKLVGYNITFY